MNVVLVLIMVNFNLNLYFCGNQIFELNQNNKPYVYTWIRNTTNKSNSLRRYVIRIHGQKTVLTNIWTREIRASDSIGYLGNPQIPDLFAGSTFVSRTLAWTRYTYWTWNSAFMNFHCFVFPKTWPKIPHVSGKIPDGWQHCKYARNV